MISGRDSDGTEITADDNFAIRLRLKRVHAVECGRDAGGESRVQTAVRVQPCQSCLGQAAHRGKDATDHDFTVRQRRDTVDKVVHETVEGTVSRAVGIQTREI